MSCPKNLFSVFLLLLGSFGCQSAVNKAARDVKYSAYELVGVQKRDLLKKQVNNAREEQKEAGEDFQDALERLKAVYGFEGGELEKRYNALKSSFDQASDQAAEVRKSIAQLETVAKDLFEEWEKEIEEIESASLKSKSRRSLSDTKARYAKLHQSLKRSEKKMEPVLQQFKDQVLYLKHNLNAQALSSLKSEAIKIENDIEQLIREMNKSISSADQFTMEIP